MNYGDVAQAVEKAYCAERPAGSRVGLLGGLAGQQTNALAPKEPGLKDRAEELMNYISRLSVNQSLLREKLFGEGEAKCVSEAKDRPVYSLESLLAIACQNAANLVGESEGILRRL
jgi:hypothetical protein